MLKEIRMEENESQQKGSAPFGNMLETGVTFGLEQSSQASDLNKANEIRRRNLDVTTLHRS